MTKARVCVVVASVLAGCASNVPINGRMERSDEAFAGAISGAGRRGSTGELVLRSSRGATCRGTFVYTSRLRGEGVLDCDDRRTGTFRIVGARGVGSGSGELAGQRFTFTFDDRD